MAIKRLGIVVAFILDVFTVIPSFSADNIVQVTEEGAKGDARGISVSTKINSTLVKTVPGYSFTEDDVGKIMLIYGAGAATTPTNNQDYLGKIVKVLGGTQVEMSIPLRRTASNLPALFGADNSPAFQRCVDRAYGSNTVIMVPRGNYLLVPSDLMNSGYAMRGDAEIRAAVVLQKGGITFSGANPKTTILTACGAWQLKGKYVSRGMLFECRGPIRNRDFPLIFENLTFDGAVEQGRGNYRGFPARVTDGNGWDMTHGAVLDAGSPPLHAFKAFRNCIFKHWRGEILKGVSGATNGFIEIMDCDFRDGNASAFNFSFAHHIDHCTFSHLDMAMEFYEGRMDRPSCFENSSVSDVRADIVIVGALTNHPAPLYTIRNNNLEASNGFGVFLNPAKNVLIESNRFEGQGFTIGNGAGAQGTDYIHDIVIRGNVCTNAGELLLVQCGYNNRMENILITGNVISGRGKLGGGWGYSTNVTFSNNLATNGASGFDGSRLLGQWFLDDASNDYRAHQVINYSGITNIISYANGARQDAVPVKTNSLFMIDDSNQRKIPPGANLLITYHGKNPSPLYLSSVHTNKPAATILKPGNVITCVWTNGEWKIEK